MTEYLFQLSNQILLNIKSPIPSNKQLYYKLKEALSRQASKKLSLFITNIARIVSQPADALWAIADRDRAAKKSVRPYRCDCAERFPVGESVRSAERKSFAITFGEVRRKRDREREREAARRKSYASSRDAARDESESASPTGAAATESTGGRGGSEEVTEAAAVSHSTGAAAPEHEAVALGGHRKCQLPEARSNGRLRVGPRTARER